MALINVKLTITTSSETYEVRLPPRAQMAWEQRFKKSLMALGEQPEMTEIFGLGYEATKYSGKTVPAKFEDWVDTLVDIDLDFLDPENPTNAAPSVD